MPEWLECLGDVQEVGFIMAGAKGQRCWYGVEVHLVSSMSARFKHHLVATDTHADDFNKAYSSSFRGSHFLPVADVRRASAAVTRSRSRISHKISTRYHLSATCICLCPQAAIIYMQVMVNESSTKLAGCWSREDVLRSPKSRERWTESLTHGMLES